MMMVGLLLRDLVFEWFWFVQIAVYNLVLRLFSSRGVLFYCHFPDQLLTQRSSWLKTL